MTHSASPATQPGVAIEGSVHGGQQPVVGARVYLLAANHTGYGGNDIVPSVSNASVSLLTPNSSTSRDASGDYFVTTASDGTFSITGDYTCTSNQQVYIYSVGGNSGSGINPAIGLLAALGSCPSSGTFSSTIPFVALNEVSTIATAYALAGFASDAIHVSSSATPLAATGIANAFKNVTNLEDLATGTALATIAGGYGTAPQATVNSLADILAACVNSSDNGFTNCATLFTNAKNSSGVLPTDTASAAINIAHNPANNVAVLFGLISSTSPFVSPTSTSTFTGLSAAPNDFTLGINFTGGGLAYPTSLAIDAEGNAWVANGVTLSEFSSLGLPLSTDNGFTAGDIASPSSLAIDIAGNIWIANAGDDSLSKFSSVNTATAASSNYTLGGLSSPQSIAFDTAGNVWVANGGSDVVSEFSSSGTPAFAYGFNPIQTASPNAALISPTSIAADASGNIWVGDSSASIFEFNGVNTATVNNYTGGGSLNLPENLALDHSGNLWFLDSTIGVAEISNSGTLLSPSADDTGGGQNQPDALAIDGSGNIWVANYNGDSVSELASSGTAISSSEGYTGGTIGTDSTGSPIPNMSSPSAIAIDGSGDVWIANQDTNSLTELIGAATPVVTPLVANLLPPYSAAASKP